MLTDITVGYLGRPDTVRDAIRSIGGSIEVTITGFSADNGGTDDTILIADPRATLQLAIFPFEEMPQQVSPFAPESVRFLVHAAAPGQGVLWDISYLDYFLREDGTWRWSLTCQGTPRDCNACRQDHQLVAAIPDGG